MNTTLDGSWIDEWASLGAVSATALVDVRLQAHWAAQIVSAVGYTHLPPRDDDSHSSLAWKDGVLVTETIDGAGGFRAGLWIDEMTIGLLDGNLRPVERFALANRTLEDGYNWMEQAIARQIEGQAPATLARRDYDMPGHPVGRGASFGGVVSDAARELARWFANAHEALAAVQSDVEGAGPVRCWPHHFDIATLIELKDADGEASHGEPRSVGVGMTPGDQEFAEPYWYVTPWPRPPEPELPQLEGCGAWHVVDWFGAVLMGTSVVAAGDAMAQAHRTDAFLRSAIAGGLSLLG